MGRTALVIANPAAGFGAAADSAERAAARLGTLGLRAELFRTSGPGDGERAARNAAGVFDVVIAAGGDGTVHEVANGLALTQTPMGVVGLGSMNILAREIGMPLHPERASEWLARAEPAPVTLGMRDERYFVLMAGIGYDAFALEMALARAGRARRKINFLDYVLTGISAPRLYPFPSITVEGDGVSTAGAFAFVANCARYGANLRIARRARLEEPLLDLVLFTSGRYPDLFRYLALILTGRQMSARGVLYRKVERLTVRGPAGGEVPCQLDGERSIPLPATLRAVPDALLLLRRSGSS